MEHLLNATPLWLLVLALFLALLAAREAGAWISRRLAPQHVEEDDSERGFILSGVLGLLALLIAFTFGLALDRYQTRRDLVVTEANAIGTAEMRVRLLDAPHAARLSGMLHDYAETRLRYGEATAAEKPPLQQASADLRGLIQTETLNALRPVRTTPLATLVAPAINETLDIGAAREAAHQARVPTAVIVVLILYALVSAGVLGAALKGARHGHRAMTGLMFLLLTLALGLILDLDRARSGAIVISQEPMAALVRSLRTAPPP
jgi:hypothetical protein